MEHVVFCSMKGKNMFFFFFLVLYFSTLMSQEGGTHAPHRWLTVNRTDKGQRGVDVHPSASRRLEARCVHLAVQWVNNPTHGK